MSQRELQQLIDWVIVSMSSDVTEDSVQALRALLPDGLVVAAFDLVDCGKVIKYTTSWGRSFFEVVGSEKNYAVSVDLPSPTPCYCSCPTFALNVLMSDKQATCKHVLAVQIARKLNLCIERAISQDELVTILCSESKPVIAQTEIS